MSELSLESLARRLEEVERRLNEKEASTKRVVKTTSLTLRLRGGCHAFAANHRLTLHPDRTWAAKAWGDVTHMLSRPEPVVANTRRR